ncbi:MAG: hypothetical protein FJ284_04765 [Planctomycetes bacterium]|nr:hypothetical protein [Planctomycetota bacterium]
MPSRRGTLFALWVVGLAAAAAAGEPELEPAASRPVMTERPSGAARERPPSQRELVDARVELQRRFREPLFRADTASGAERAAESLLEAAGVEPDRSLKWLLYAEARRLGVVSGNADVIHRAVTLASATYEFDALDDEVRDLAGIPLRGVSPRRAVGLAEAAEGVAGRAEVDGRFELALRAQDLAIKAWQRAGAIEACRRAMVRHGEIAAALDARRSGSGAAR